MSRQGYSRARTATLAVLAVSIAAVFGAPSALGDTDCADGWVCGVTEPPIPPDQAGNPTPVTTDWVPIPDVPPSVGIDLGLPQPPHRKACHARKHKHHASAAKTCKKKRR